MNLTISGKNHLNSFEKYIQFCKNPLKSWIGLYRAPRFITLQGQRVPNQKWRPFVVTLPKKKFAKIRKMNKEQLSYKSNNPRQGEINTQIYKLYDELDTEFNYFRSLSNSLCFKHKFIKIDKTNRVVQPSLLKNLYIPTKIANYIIDNATVLLEYNCQLDSERTVKINFIIFNI